MRMHARTILRTGTILASLLMCEKNIRKRNTVKDDCTHKPKHFNTATIASNLAATCLLSIFPLTTIAIASTSKTYNYFNQKGDIRKICKPLPKSNISICNNDIKIDNVTIATLDPIGQQDETQQKHFIFNFGGRKSTMLKKGIINKDCHKDKTNTIIVRIDPTYQDSTPELLVNYLKKKHPNAKFSAVGFSAGCVTVERIKEACKKAEIANDNIGHFIQIAPVVNQIWFPDASHWFTAPLAATITSFMSTSIFQQSVMTSKEEKKEDTYSEKTTIIFHPKDQLGQFQEMHETNIRSFFKKLDKNNILVLNDTEVPKNDFHNYSVRQKHNHPRYQEVQKMIAERIYNPG